MTKNNIASLHLHKLGHELEEIRVRALNNIISKLDYGTIDWGDLTSNKELVSRLIDWLLKYDNSREREKVLRLLIRILHAGGGKKLSSYLSTPNISSQLSSIRSNIEPALSPLVDLVINSISTGQVNDNGNKFVNLQQETDRGSSSSSVETINSEEEKQDRLSDLHLLDRESPTVTHRPYQYKQGYFNTSQEVPVQDQYPSCFPHLLLPWQPLILTDRHVLTATEESLKSSRDPALILHSCHFFNDIILQDFPAEVFLQRPAIVRSLIELLDMTRIGNSKRVCPVVMNCLSKLTAMLQVRVQYYSDPCIANLKQETCTTSLNASVTSQPDSFTNQQVFVEEGAGDYLRNCNPLSDRDHRPSALKYQSADKPPHRSHRQANICDEAEDSILLQLRQLNLPQFCLLTLSEVIPHMSNYSSVDLYELTQAMDLTTELLKLLFLCVSPSLWKCNDVISSEIAHHMKHILVLFGQAIDWHQKQKTANVDNRLVYLQLLSLCQKFLDSLVPIKAADEVIPNILKNALTISIFDNSICKLIPMLHRNISAYSGMFSGQPYSKTIQRYKETTAVCKSMRAAIKFVRNSFNKTEDDVFSLMKEALPSLVYHMDLNYVTRCVEVCVGKHHRLTSEASSVLVSLLAHSEPEVKRQTYETCHHYVSSILGVEHTKPHWNPKQLAFIYSTPILIEIICHGTSNSNKEIRTFSEEILTYLLKGKFLMSKSTWQTFLESLAPALPLLQCYASKTTNLGRTVGKILDPDVGLSICLPFDEVLKGNLRLMFSVDALSRDEAVSRLMWLLSREPQSYDKLPELTSLHCNVLNSLCIVEHPAELSCSKFSKPFYEEASLCQVVELLTAAGVDPVVRRSALAQICVMLEDKRLHSTFIEQGGVETVLEIFEKAILEKDFTNQPDSVIPIVTILKNLSLQNHKVRQDLSRQTSVYFSVLRAGFMYCNDNRLRLDASQLLFMLLYSDLILSVPEVLSKQGDEVTASYGISLPELAVTRMRVPFLCHSHWRTSHHTETSFRGELMNDDQSLQFLKLSWNVEWYGNITTILSWEGLPQHSESFARGLEMNKNVLECVKSTAISNCCRKNLFDIQNATSHVAVAMSLWRLSGYITLYSLVENIQTDGKKEQLDVRWDDFPWEKTLLRFVGTLPACDEDEELLMIILKFLRKLIATRKGENCYWITKILKGSNRPLPCILKVSNNTDTETNPCKDLCREIFLLSKECATAERKPNHVDKAEGAPRKKTHSWSHIIRTISGNLKFSDTQHFYNLSFLDWMLSCLAHLTGSIGWSIAESGAGKLFSELVSSLMEIVSAFHCARGGAGGASFMGLGITRSAILCMNHLLAEMLENPTLKGWESAWQRAMDGRSGDPGSSGWLAALWESRDPVTRAAALQLAAGFCSSRRGVGHLTRGLHVWSAALAFLLDHEESCLVREQAAILLANLTSHSTPSCAGDEGSLSLCPAPDDAPLTGRHALLRLLDQSNFYGEVATLVSRLYVGSTVDLGGYVVTLENGHWSTESLSGRQLVPGGNSKSNEYILVYDKNVDGGPLSSSTLSSRSENTEENGNECEPYVVTTSSLVKSVSQLLLNLTSLTPGEVSKNVNAFGLARSVFRCLTPAPAFADERKAAQFYMDVLELDSSVCAVLAAWVAADDECRETVLHTFDSLSTLLKLLDPTLFPIHLPHLLFLRNRLWTSIFHLISSLLADKEDVGYKIFCETLQRCGSGPFFAAFMSAMSDQCSATLLQSSLCALTSLLCHEANSLTQLDVTITATLQTLLDQPRTIDTNSGETKLSVGGERSVGGAEICELLLGLYEAHRLQQEDLGSGRGKTIVAAALANLVAVSWEAKRQALRQGLLEIIIVQLRELHVKLSIDSVECLKRISDKKRVCPALKEISGYFVLLTNFASGCVDVKLAAAEMGLADLVHKLWVWCLALPDLLAEALKLLCTLTTDCVPACHSLALTTTVPGIGLRKTASSASILHAVFKLIAIEMEHFGRQQGTMMLSLAFQLLGNACRAQECRLVIGKGSLLQSLGKLHPALTKKQKNWQVLEVICMEFLETFTFYNEGQLGVPKVADALDLLLTLANGGQTATKMKCLLVLRNVAFNPTNRSRLLASGDFLQLLVSKLSDGSLEEKCIVAAMVWALVANNQKAKLIVKCAGIDVKLQEVFNHLNILLKDPDDDRIKTISYVLGILRKEESKVKR